MQGITISAILIAISIAVTHIALDMIRAGDEKRGVQLDGDAYTVGGVLKEMAGHLPWKQFPVLSFALRSPARRNVWYSIGAACLALAVGGIIWGAVSGSPIAFPFIVTATAVFGAISGKAWLITVAAVCGTIMAASGAATGAFADVLPGAAAVMFCVTGYVLRVKAKKETT